MEALGTTVVHCAVGAALHDPRFSPVVMEEIVQLMIEISVLSIPEPIPPGEIQVGIHGLLIRRDQFRGVLLPKVARERGWSREKFLDETCQKAGLPPHSWRDPQTECLAFTDEAFSEADFE
jgi:AmmeMemoRadiSam system protein A